MTDTLSKVAIISAVFCIAILLLANLFKPSASFGSAPSGIITTVATTSSVLVGPSVASSSYALVPIFQPSQCNSRIISTAAQPIMISFAAMSSTTVGGQYGAVQAASTTVAYDSGLYGCGLWSVYGYTASTTIFVEETR